MIPTDTAQVTRPAGDLKQLEAWQRTPHHLKITLNTYVWAAESPLRDTVPFPVSQSFTKIYKCVKQGS